MAEEIRAMMARRRITGLEMARQLGVSNAWVSYRLNGRQAIDLNDLERIAMVLEVSIHELLPIQDPDAPGELRPRRRAVDARRRSGTIVPYVRLASVTGPRGRMDVTRPGDVLLTAA